MAVVRAEKRREEMVRVRRVMAVGTTILEKETRG